MGSWWRVGTIRGIEIGIHPSWLLVFFLVAWTLAVGLFPFQYPGLGRSTYWLMGFSASTLLFASVLIHELAHSFVALSRGLPVKSITLFIFGGVANIGREARSATDEFLIAVVGPLASLALGGIFWAVGQAMGPGAPAIEGVISYLASINVLLALFNLIPGFPLDGGRVLRAVLWGVTKNLQKATRIASTIGSAIGYLFVFSGVFIALNGALINGLWLAFIGWFLNNAAQAASQQTELQTRLRGITVSRLMDPSPMVVEPNTRLSDVVEDYVLQRGIRALPVVDVYGIPHGMVTLAKITSVPRDRWADTPARFAMVTARDLHAVTPSTPLDEALRKMVENDVNQLPVIDGDRLVGLLSRSNILRFLQVLDELGMTGAEATREMRKAA